MATNPLDGVHPRLVAGVHKILDAMMILGCPMRITEGLRTDARQAALFAEGRTAPGNIVTHCNGASTRSAHQQQSDGYGHAVDCCFASDTPWDGPWALFGLMATQLGLVWGGGFTTLVDRPHLELPSSAYRLSQAARASASSSSS